MPEPTGPSRDANVTPPCGVCNAATPPGRARRWCSPACRQSAYRRRSDITTTAFAAPLSAAKSRREGTVYRCPTCDLRLLGEQRCPDCHTFAVRLGPGGPCPYCDEPVAVTDLQAPPLD